jgi:hypothetical protein
MTVWTDGKKKQVKYFFKACSGWKKKAAGWKSAAVEAFQCF